MDPKMLGLIGYLAELYFNNDANREQYEGWPGSTFSRFLPIVNQPTATLWIAGLSYRLVIGFIEYTDINGAKMLSTTIFMFKYLETLKWPPMTRQGIVPYSRELNFYESVLASFARVRMTHHMFLKFCISGTLEMLHDNRKLIMYEWPERTSVFENLWSILDVESCTMMLSKIGHFHARSLLMKKRLPDVFESLNCANSPPQRFDVDRVHSTLLFCLDQLALNPRYDTGDAERFDRGVMRFAQMISRFDELLMVPFLRPSDHHPPRPSAHELCWVMCHRNYGKESVLFEGGAEDMKIFNYQSMGLASLGVDVVIPLFVEPLGMLIPTNVANMLKTYYMALTEVVPEDERPEGLTEEFVKEEIKKSVPFALYTLASRIVYANTESQFQKSIFTPDVWTEYRVEDRSTRRPLENPQSLQPQNSIFKPDVWTKNRLVELCEYLIMDDYM